MEVKYKITEKFNQEIINEQEDKLNNISPPKAKAMGIRNGRTI